MHDFLYLHAELLIMDFIREETNCLQNTDASCGELYIELSTQTFTGELQGTIRGEHLVTD